MKNCEMKTSQATVCGQCIGSSNLIGGFRMTQDSSLADGASGVAVSHLASDWRILL